ncbi:hypothetical protein HanRHA438_Chr12g0537581 [Helianthus annuus]|nr:hypothetical protein HanRHA438_Chr12g0537581 [Helianthus annuus]
MICILAIEVQCAKLPCGSYIETQAKSSRRNRNSLKSPLNLKRRLFHLAFHKSLIICSPN